MTDREVLSPQMIHEMSRLYDENQDSPGWAMAAAVVNGRGIIAHSNLSETQAADFKDTLHEIIGKPQPEPKAAHPSPPD